jgi:hypothetical protein
VSAEVAILVPRRAGFADRDALWAFCRPWWERNFPDVRIVEGHHDVGLFSRSAAVNTAARLAGDWDVAILIDSDVLVDPGRVREAIPLALETGQMVVPFEVRYNLSLHGTRRVLGGYAGSWKGLVARTFRDQHSSVIVIPRTLFDDVGGFDEGFRGWGMEDTAFALSCELFAGRPLVRLPGECWHLHHASAPGEKHGTPSHRRNLARLGLYRDAVARGDRHRVATLVAEGRESEDVPPDSIPRILHRVVPEKTSAVVEDWWERFGKLHPTWRLMTWRDPLDPADFPMTSGAWGRVKCGAQLADLARLEVLFRYGGVYVDSDMEPFRPLDALLWSHHFAAWEDERTIPNALIGARAGSSLIESALKLALRTMRRSVWEAGPGVTTKLFADRTDVLLLPPGAVYRVHYNDPARDDLMTSLPPAPWEFMRHHYFGSWLPPERRRVPE